MKTKMLSLFTILGALAVCRGAQAAETAAAVAAAPEQPAAVRAVPKSIHLMIAGFGTVESMTQVDKWLDEQLQSTTNLRKAPTLSDGDKLAHSDIQHEIVYLNWKTRKTEYIREIRAVNETAEANARLLRALRTKVLTDTATRYVPLAKDYLQAALSEQGCRLVKVVDRSNADMSMVEQAINGKSAGTVAGATCILTAAFGDREEESRTIPVNGKGTMVKMTTFTQPYVGKIRDLSGNVLLAFHGTAVWKSRRNNIVQSEEADPARKLVEAACAQIAEKVMNFFTTELTFKVKVPSELDEDEVSVVVDGKNVDAIEEGVRVLAIEHAIVATLEGCKPIQRVIVIDEATPAKTVKLTFKKKAKTAPSGDDE